MQAASDAEANLPPNASLSSGKAIETFSLKHRSLRLKGASIPTIQQITKHEFTRYAREHWLNGVPFPPGAIQISSVKGFTKEEDSSIQAASYSDSAKTSLSQSSEPEIKESVLNPANLQVSAQDEATLEIFTYAIKNLPEYRAFDSSLIVKLYEDLKASNFELPKVMILEFSQYFENYLWPYFHSRAATLEHLMSIILIVNEKIRQNIPIWDCFLCQTSGISVSYPSPPAPISVNTADFSIQFHSEVAKSSITAANGITSVNASLDSNVKAISPDTSSTLLHYTPVNEIFLSRKFQRFFYRVLLLHMHTNLSAKEQSLIIRFLIKCFQSLEQEMVRKVCLSVCGSATWFHLAESFREGFIAANVSAERLWKRTLKRYNKLLENVETTTQSKEGTTGKEEESDAKAPIVLETSDQNLSSCIMNEWTFAFVDKNYFKCVLDDFLYRIEEQSTEKDVTMEDLLYVERFVEFLIDLLNQLPTRRMIRPLLVGKQIVVRCKLSQIAQHVEGSLFCQLVDILSFYESFEINDETGLPLSHIEYTDLHYRKVKEFQKMCFKYFKEDSTLLKVALLNISAIDSSASLNTLLESLSLPTLFSLCEQLKLMDASEILGNSPDDKVFGLKSEKLCNVSQKKSKQWVNTFLKAVLLHYLEQKPDQLQRINETPVYPNEELLWDPNLVPAEHYYEDYTLALPKLNLQFLTIHDYLLRNFNLYRLESTYEIREDLEDAIYRMKGRIDNEGRAAFEGSARMAISLQSLNIILVQKPNIGSTVPAEVRAEIVINLQSLKSTVRSEWDALRQFDVLFLVAISPPLERYQGHLSELVAVTDFPEKFGVLAVRGAEIIEVLDEEGNVISDQNPVDYVEPMGNLRTLRVSLDSAQYQLDIQQMQEEGYEDLYGTFNLVIRRKAKENNFKAVLETIKTLMNNPEDTIIPGWLHDLFLGYGDPSSALYSNLPTELTTIDFLDTFLDSSHIVDAFPNALYIQCPPTLKAPFCLTFRKSSGKGESIDVCTYTQENRGPYPECERRRNTIRFTSTQVRCIRSGINPGLTMVVGPPGTGKTDTAVQIVNLLYHNFTDQRILLVAHSNQALNDLFEKIVQLDIDERYLLRLGLGEQELQLEKDFSKWGRVNFMLERRLHLLRLVERLGTSLGVVGDVSFTCETSLHFYLFHILSRIERYRKFLKDFLASSHDAEKRAVLTRFYKEEGEGAFALSAPPFEICLKEEEDEEGDGGDGNDEERGAEEEDEEEDEESDGGDEKREDDEREADEEEGKVAELEDDEEGKADEEKGEADDEEGEAALPGEFVGSGQEDPEAAQREEITRFEDASVMAVPPFTLLPLEEQLDVLLNMIQAGRESAISILFPFKKFFEDAPQPLFCGNFEEDKEAAEGCFRYLEDIFKEIEECQAFELLRTAHDRGDYLLTKHARIVAMTCTHAALTRQKLVDLKFKYDSLIMEEAAQVLEVETFIPMLLQQAEKGLSRLKRVVLIGDHHQLPPIIQNRAFQQYARFDQSLFTRFIRLKVPFVQLDFQGRARPEIANLYNWEYEKLGDLPAVLEGKAYQLANAGFGLDFQFIDVGKYNGVGETAPLPHFYQNLGEAEYVVAVYMYMRIIGYPAEKITLITTYNGQKALLEDIIQQRCAWNPAIGWPAKISTVDKYQGQQNDYILLSLVRTERVGHIRDIRRLIVAMSRARLGLYIFGRWSLFNNCFELAPVMNRLSHTPVQLALLLEEFYPTERKVGTSLLPVYISDVTQMFQIVQTKAKEMVERIKTRLGHPSATKSAARPSPSPPPPPAHSAPPSSAISAFPRGSPLLRGTPAFRLPAGLMGFFNPRPLPLPQRDAPTRLGVPPPPPPGTGRHPPSFPPTSGLLPSPPQRIPSPSSVTGLLPSPSKSIPPPPPPQNIPPPPSSTSGLLPSPVRSIPPPPPPPGSGLLPAPPGSGLGPPTPSRLLHRLASPRSLPPPPPLPTSTVPHSPFPLPRSVPRMTPSSVPSPPPVVPSFRGGALPSLKTPSSPDSAHPFPLPPAFVEKTKGNGETDVEGLDVAAALPEEMIALQPCIAKKREKSTVDKEESEEASVMPSKRQREDASVFIDTQQRLGRIVDDGSVETPTGSDEKLVAPPVEAERVPFLVAPPVEAERGILPVEAERGIPPVEAKRGILPVEAERGIPPVEAERGEPLIEGSTVESKVMDAPLKASKDTLKGRLRTKKTKEVKENQNEVRLQEEAAVAAASSKKTTRRSTALKAAKETSVPSTSPSKTRRKRSPSASSPSPPQKETKARASKRGVRTASPSPPCRPSTCSSHRKK